MASAKGDHVLQACASAAANNLVDAGLGYADLAARGCYASYMSDALQDVTIRANAATEENEPTMLENAQFSISSSQTPPANGFAAVARIVACPRLLGFDIAAASLALVVAMADYFLTLQIANPALFLALRISIKHLLVAVACWATWSLMLWLSGLYQPFRTRSMARLVGRMVTGATTCALMTYIPLFYRNEKQNLGRTLITFWATTLGLMTLSRLTVYGFERLVRPHFRKLRRVVVVGSRARAQRLAALLPLDPTYNYDLAGFIDRNTQETVNGIPVLGDIAHLEEVLMREQIDEVFIALPIRSHYEEIAQVIALCEASGVQSQYQATFFNTSIAKKWRSSSNEDGSRVTLEMVHNDHRLLIKRAFDFLVAFFGLLFLSPVLLIIAIMVKTSSEGPIFFSQTRFGFNKRKFGMHKFRSMVLNAERLQKDLEHLNEVGGPLFKIKNDPRITKIGKFLRKSSLDELPQLWNVLVGDMSLVGPRPLPMRDVDNFTVLPLMRRFSVKPGMTGLWQVSGRSDNTFDGWVAKDLQYIDTWSLSLDAWILVKTIPAVMRGRGAS